MGLQQAIAEVAEYGEAPISDDEQGGECGFALEADDFDDDGFDDLVVGAPGETIGEVVRRQRLQSS